MPRLLIFLVVVLLVFLPLNMIAAVQLMRIHPRRKALVIFLVTFCNLTWLLLPFLQMRTPLLRVLRAMLGPPWFAWLCFVIVYCGVLLVIAILWIPFRGRPFREFARWPSRLFLWGTIAAILIGVPTALIPLDVRRVPITLKDLPPDFDGFRIALVADLHVGLFTRPSRLRQIFETVNGVSPDVVLIAGDMIDDDPAFVPKLLDGVRWLKPSTPLLAVLGNHEMYGNAPEVRQGLSGSRIHLLVNQGTELRGLWFAGLSDYAAQAKPFLPDFDAALAGKPRETFPIVVSHQPRSYPESQRRHLPLTLCAHSHGGQCGFRPLHWTLAGVFLPYHMGLYQRGTSQLYVNTGTGYWLLPWRLGLLPEITVIELRRPLTRPSATLSPLRGARADTVVLLPARGEKVARRAG